MFSVHFHRSIHVYQVTVVIFSFICIVLHSDNNGKWNYTGVKLAPESSVTILAGSLQLNRTYQFLLQMINRQDASLQVTGYVLAEIKDSNRPMIAMG